MGVRTFRTIRRIRPGNYLNFVRGVILGGREGASGFALGPRSGEADPMPARSEGDQLAQMVCSACHIVAIQHEFRAVTRVLKDLLPSTQR